MNLTEKERKLFKDIVKTAEEGARYSIKCRVCKRYGSKFKCAGCPMFGGLIACSDISKLHKEQKRDLHQSAWEVILMRRWGYVGKISDTP